MIKHLLKTATVKSWQRSTKKETLYKNAFRYSLLKGLKLIQFTFIYSESHNNSCLKALYCKTYSNTILNNELKIKFLFMIWLICPIIFKPLTNIVYNIGFNFGYSNIFAPRIKAERLLHLDCLMSNLLRRYTVLSHEYGLFASNEIKVESP